MTNKQRGEVTVRVAGEDHVMRFTHDAIERLDAALVQQGGVIGAIYNNGMGPGPLAVRAALEVGLNPGGDRKEAKRIRKLLKRRKAGEWPDQRDAVLEAVAASGLFGDADSDEDADGADPEDDDDEDMDEGEAAPPARPAGGSYPGTS